MRYLSFLFLFTTAFYSVGSQAGLKEMLELKSPYELGKLPYAADSLEPFIDKETMTIHHDKHHQAYVTTLNENLKEKGITLQALFKKMSEKSDKIRNNAGGHWNHTFFWEMMSQEKTNTTMPEELKKELVATFGSLEKFKEEFETKGKGQFGSGWVWLIRNQKGGLEITSTPNQDNPMMNNVATRGLPILGADIWEHAYYLKYKNERIKYLQNFWNVVNWKRVSEYAQESKALKVVE